MDISTSHQIPLDSALATIPWTVIVVSIIVAVLIGTPLVSWIGRKLVSLIKLEG